MVNSFFQFDFSFVGRRKDNLMLKNIDVKSHYFSFSEAFLCWKFRSWEWESKRLVNNNIKWYYRYRYIFVKSVSTLFLYWSIWKLSSTIYHIPGAHFPTCGIYNIWPKPRRAQELIDLRISRLCKSRSSPTRKLVNPQVNEDAKC